MWIEHSISELIRNGELQIGDGYRAKNSELSQSGIPFARAGNIDAGFAFEGADRFPLKALHKVGHKVSAVGDVVFTSKGTVGRFAFVDGETERFVYSPQLCFWRSLNPNKIDPYYLFCWMHGDEFGDQINALKGQTDMADYVSLTDQRLMKISLPDIEKQRDVVSVIEPLNRRIALNERLNAALEATAAAVFKSWFVDFDPVVAKPEGRKPFGMTDEIAALFPDRFDANGVPEGWKPSTIGQEVSVVGGSTPSTSRPEFWEGQNAWVTPKDLSTHRDPWLVDTSRKITALGVRQISSGVLPIGTVLLSSRAPIGYTVISSIPVSINQGFIAMKPTGDLSSLFTYLWTKENLEEVLTRAGGTTFAEISKASFRPIPVVVPKRELLTAFEDVAGPMFDRILLNQKQNRALRNLRDAILPGLVSGELQIMDVEREIAGVAG